MERKKNTEKKDTKFHVSKLSSSMAIFGNITSCYDSEKYLPVDFTGPLKTDASLFPSEQIVGHCLYKYVYVESIQAYKFFRLASSNS